MPFGVFLHRSDSPYDDVPWEQYQFPKQYLGRVTQCIGDWVIYLEPRKVPKSRGYFAVARVQDVIPDPRNSDLFLARIETGSYLPFGDPVAFSTNGQVVERGLLNDRGRLSGRAQAAVRPLSELDFHRIIQRGLDGEPVLPRRDSMAEPPGFSEQPEVFEPAAARLRIEQLVSRPLRDQNFRRSVLRAYGERCAVTGLRLINGGGRAEVEAAHIRPVEADGPDIVGNGLALSGTAHWMFDRGLIGLSDQLEILISRQANDAAAVRGLINESGHLIAPRCAGDWPRREYVSWHREHRFKR